VGFWFVLGFLGFEGCWFGFFGLVFGKEGGGGRESVGRESVWMESKGRGLGGLGKEWDVGGQGGGARRTFLG